jgi:hypothetical protein
MSTAFHPADAARFTTALRHIDEENGKDPNVETCAGAARPRELVYSEWLTAWVLRLAPDASEALRLAARSQHICRWMSPRDSFPMTRPGYLQWRAELKKFHAQKAGEILQETGYPPEMVERVQALIQKKNFPNDPEGRVLEDALCLVFLERQLGPLTAKATDAKLINALQKSWNKMTPQARNEALRLNFSARERALIEQALQSSEPG